MNIRYFDRDNTIIEMNYDTLYVLLQCVADVRDRLSENDIDTIIGVDRNFLKDISVTFNELKWKMRPKTCP